MNRLAVHQSLVHPLTPLQLIDLLRETGWDSLGLHIGAVAGALIAYGLSDRLIGFVGPHGFLELSVIVIAGACGLMLGRAIVWADLRPRGQALAAAGGRSIRLLLGSLPFMVVAGLVEGFVFPTAFHWPFKLAIGLFTAVVMYSYFLLVGRTPARPRAVA